MVQDRAIVTMADQQKVVDGVSNRAILLWKVNRKPYPSFQMVPFSVTFNDL